MGLGRRWTPEEEEYLSEHWGDTSIPTLAKTLNRSVNGIKVRASRLKLGPVLEGGDYVTLNQLLKAIGIDSGGYKIISWVQNRGLPVHKHRVIKNSFNVIRLNEFWAWAEKNRSFIDFSKFPPLALGAEPDWVKEQRKKDGQQIALQRKDCWTPLEDAQLISLLQENKWGYQELSRKLRRSNGAIQRRILTLGLTERPIRKNAHEAKWTEDDFSILGEGIRHGDSYMQIGEKIGKSEKAIRGKAYAIYLTEDQDKIRGMMGDKPWGYGAPEPNIHQCMVLSSQKTKAKKAISELVGVLMLRRNYLAGWDAYFQRHMCMHWDDAEGCKAGEKECDSCLSFQRIRPQYCCRCGKSFLERKENRFCLDCRNARMKKAQRKWRREKEENADNG